jgi:LmbE family N-acetylglucosaminyl deacetylase
VTPTRSEADRPTSVLVLSPHLDDAVLSIGGYIAQLAATGHDVVVATLFTGQPPAPVPPGARAFHEQCGLGDDAMRHRMDEDIAACRVVGARPRHRDLPEALYRIDASGLPRHRDGRAIFQADPSNENDVVDAARRHVRTLLNDLRPHLVLGPLGVGDHIDHAIIHRALRSSGIESRLLHWFEDIPYVLYRHTRDRTDEIGRSMRPHVVPINAEHWAAKIAAIACYRSQAEVLWHDNTPWTEQVRDYAVDVGGGRPAERLWWSG